MKQGPRFEADTVNALDGFGLKAKRIDKSGENGVSDVQVGEPDATSPVFLRWKRYSGGGPRRNTQTIWVLDDQEFWLLLAAAIYPLIFNQGQPYSTSTPAGVLDNFRYRNFYIECKAAERVNVTATLEKAIEKVRAS